MNPHHIISYVSAAIGVSITLFLTFLILRQKNKDRAVKFLLMWFFFQSIVMQFWGSLIIYQTEASKALYYYQIGMIFTGFIASFYFFVNSYLKSPGNRLLNIVAVIYIVFDAGIHLVQRDFVVRNVIWDPIVEFYIIDLELRFPTLLIYSGFIFWLYGIVKLFLVYRNSKSALERNKLQYLILGGLIPLIGLIIITIPNLAIRRYPVDMWAATLGVVLISYGILKYKLFNISLIIRRGLIYSILTIIVTSIYLSFALLIQFLLPFVDDAPVSVPASISTALVVALIFQPLQNVTQGLIDRLFFRRDYVPEELLGKISNITNESVDVEMLSQQVLGVVVGELQLTMGRIYIRQEESNRFHLIAEKNTNPTESKLERRENIELDPSQYAYFTEPERVFSVYDATDTQTKALFKELGSALLIPFVNENQLLGFVSLGEKLSEQAYTLDEYKLLLIMSDQITTALQKAFLFDAVKKEKQQVEELLEHEREVDEMKSEFLMITSHHLRTPITAIQGYTQSLERESNQLTHDGRDDLIKLNASIARLTKIVEQLLTVASIDKGQILVNMVDTNLAVEVMSAVNSFQDQAHQKSIQLNYQDPEMELPIVKSDKPKIRLVIDNLIDNAIKYTNQGEINVSVEDAQSEVIVRIQDTGVGIPEEELGKVFTMFHQVRHRYEARQGMGMGLYLSKLIVDAHGGKIWVESEAGVGSTFYFSLPVKK